jgi:hypothetical protein
LGALKVFLVGALQVRRGRKLDEVLALAQDEAYGDVRVRLADVELRIGAVDPRPAVGRRGVVPLDVRELYAWDGQEGVY